MRHLFFNSDLQAASGRIAPSSGKGSILLDKNEQPADVASELKKKVLDRLMEENWNRYPSADLSEIETKVAHYCGLGADQIVLSPGSAAMITTLLNYFALNQKRIVIAQPTYSLFDYHCKTYNIAYEPWYLSPELEYDLETLPALGPGAVLIITSPNNPVGNTLSADKLEQILKAHPESFVILDAVYAEFDDLELSPLVNRYEHLIVLRSFSKAFPVAGLRLGYLCATAHTAAVIRKLVLPFAINHFTQAFVREILDHPGFLRQSQDQVALLVRERERLFRQLCGLFNESIMKVYRSAGNFLLIRIPEYPDFQQVLKDMDRQGIKVLNTSPFPLLENTFRVTIGSPAENDAFMHCLVASLKGKVPMTDHWPTSLSPMPLESSLAAV